MTFANTIMSGGVSSRGLRFVRNAGTLCARAELYIKVSEKSTGISVAIVIALILRIPVVVSASSIAIYLR